MNIKKRTKSLSWNVFIYILVAASVGRLHEFQKRADKAEKKMRLLNMLLIGFILTFARLASVNIL